ncbi:hypothetical protein [Actinomadura sp. NPDC049753]|uniref:hypothetical protein n=1 Tax=Actinomadura sp. NPDC049753 TaxID=3154739 RepID=UPI003417CBE4
MTVRFPAGALTVVTSVAGGQQAGLQAQCLDEAAGAASTVPATASGTASTVRQPHPERPRRCC